MSTLAPPRLRVAGVAKSFPGERGRDVAALAEIDLEVGAGELVALVGPTGCGKSTLLAMIAGLIEPDRGSVELDGESGRRLGSVGLMPQRDLLMPWRTVIDNAILGPEIAGADRDEARARAREQLPRFGLVGFGDSRPAKLSGGMRQRAALLRTFLAGRSLILLDEPFGALDALTRQAMQEWLLEVWERERATIVFVTHDVREAVFLADRVAVMSRRPGRIALEVAVREPRPRSFDAPALAELERRLVGPLRREARAQIEDGEA